MEAQLLRKQQNFTYADYAQSLATNDAYWVARRKEKLRCSPCSTHRRYPE